LKAKLQIFWAQGRWQEYIELCRKIVRLSPRDASNFNDLGGALHFTKNYKEAIDAFNQGIALDPEEVWNYLGKAFSIISWKGANQESRDVLSKVSTDSEFYLWSMYYQEIMEGNHQNALQLVANTDGYGIKNKMELAPKSMLFAFINNHLGKKELAHENYKKAQEILQIEIKEYPEDYRYHSALGIAYAGLGQNEAAIAEGKKAMELLPITKNAFYGVEPILKLALIYTMTNEFDLALDQLDYVLSVPYFWTVEWLKNDMRFDPLRDHPRYRELMEKYEENQ